MAGNRRVAVCVTARPSWAKLQPVVAELRQRGYLVDLIACAYALLHHYGSIDELMKQDGTPPTCKLYAAYEGATHETAALTTGALTTALATRFAHIKPHLVIVCADRHETLAVSIAASYQNIPLLHLQGGEHTGSIDDKVRWANTMLADGHAVAHAEAWDAVSRVVTQAHRRLATRICITGCPSIDSARVALTEPAVTWAEMGGTGATFDLATPFAVACLHPDTREDAHAYMTRWDRVRAILHEKSLPAIIFWPGADAGSDMGAKWLRSAVFEVPTHYCRGLAPRRYLRLLSQSALTIGNSSAFVREGVFLDVPTVRVGARQDGRGVRDDYGDGFAASRIVNLVAEMLA